VLLKTFSRSPDDSFSFVTFALSIVTEAYAFLVRCFVNGGQRVFLAIVFLHNSLNSFGVKAKAG